MKILVVGGGGREHAIIWKLAQSPKVKKLYCAPGNGGISNLAECVPIKAMDIQGIVDFARSNALDMVMVAPDDPLVAGMVDKLEEAGIRAFGPTQKAAILEGSKAYSKELMKKYNIPTAKYEIFQNSEAAIAYLQNQSFPIVVKADGLALGKGVIIAKDFLEAKKAVEEIMEDKVFGSAGDQVVIEEFMTGPEVSILAFTDGKTIVPMVSSQDHKRALDNDQGLNTGGMGTFSPSRAYTPEMAEFCMKNIFIPTVDAMNKENRKFKGVLFFGLMLTPEGPKLLEYNARFGDPETQVVLPRLETDLVDVFNGVIDEKLEEVEIKWSDKTAVCVIMASGGYPQKYKTGYEISGLMEVGKAEDVTVFHAGTQKSGEQFLTSGGRVLGVTALGDSHEEAIKKAYENVEKLHFKDYHYRRDIGIK